MFSEKLKIKSAEFFFLILILYLPFQIALNPAADFDLLTGRLLIPALFLFWWLKLKPPQKFSWLENEAVLALMLFFLINLISVFWAQNHFWAGRKLLVFASIFPLFILAKEIVSFKSRSVILKTMIFGAIISSLIAFLQFFSQFFWDLESFFSFWSQKILPWFSGNSFGALVSENPSWLAEVQGKVFLRAFGLFPDPHMLAFFLGLVSFFPLALFLFLKKGRFFYFLIFCFFSLILVLTFSRGGYLGFLAGLFAVIFFVWPKIESEGRSFLKRGAIFFLLLAVLFGGAALVRFASSFDLDEGSNLGRLSIWQGSFDYFLKNPFLGSGLGNYPLSLDPYADYRSPVTSHNLYLDILAETGIFGLLAWFWFVFASMKAAFLKIKSATKENWIIGFGALGALVCFSIHSFFETAIFNPTVLAFLMIICSLAAAKNNGMGGKINDWKNRRSRKH